MNSIIKTKTPQSYILLKNNVVLLTAVRNHWIKDYKPGPYPDTEEKRLAAAEKYQLHPSEYKPYPDDGQGAGDYPNLPLESADSKDPFYPWDNPELKRNFNEPLHADFDLIREDRVDVNARFKRPLWYMYLQTAGTLGGALLIYLLFDKVKMFQATIPKQYPGSGKTHYTFEPKE